ncbi:MULTISPECIES: hypothetical protein [unclassified Leucobacter]|uniref:hypothetical protein n=1 Tax=unclassified Leucobacter TaxID=2621730 RepID=UPI000620E7DA|nr:hypothetical protein [Leucobacter sp. Ag1]KKI18730.1 hypothetical protein XM48_10645 [Leucobacter sp. Ag1]
MADGFTFDLGNGISLQARRLPGHTKPWLGLLVPGPQFIALAEFISDAEADYLTNTLKTRAIIVAPVERTTDHDDHA